MYISAWLIVWLSIELILSGSNNCNCNKFSRILPASCGKLNDNLSISASNGKIIKTKDMIKKPLAKINAKIIAKNLGNGNLLGPIFILPNCSTKGFKTKAKAIEIIKDTQNSIVT